MSEGAADQPGQGFGLGLESGVIGKGTGTDGVGHSAALPGTIIGKPDIRGGVGIINADQFAGVRIKPRKRMILSYQPDKNIME